MGDLKKNIAAFGCVCFLTFALFPVSMTVGDPWISILSHARHAKKLHRATPNGSFGLRSPQPNRWIVASDMLPEEDKELGNPLQSAPATRNPAASPFRGSVSALASRFTFAGKVSTHLFHSVLKL